MFEPIIFEQYPRGGFTTVQSLHDAAQVLIDWREEDEVPGFHLAARACISAMDGKGSEAVAREALVAALVETGAYVRGPIPSVSASHYPWSRRPRR